MDFELQWQRILMQVMKEYKKFFSSTKQLIQTINNKDKKILFLNDLKKIL